MINNQRLIDEFIELVKIDSPSSKEGKVAKVLVEKLEAIGCEVCIDNAGEKVGGETGNVIAKLKEIEKVKQFYSVLTWIQ